MSLRDDVLAKPTRKTVRVTIPEWDTDVLVAELDVQARIDVLAGLEVGAAGGTVKLDLNPLVPHVTSLILDVHTQLPVFELADHDKLLADHPAVVKSVLMKSFEISEIGEAAQESAVGNSERTPSVGMSSE